MNAVAYLAQEWLKAADANGGPKAAAAALAKVGQQFPARNDLRDIGKNHVRRIQLGLLKESRYADALAAIERYGPLLPEAKDKSELGGLVYDRQAEDLRTKKDFEGALQVYAEGLKAFPGEGRLRNNAIFTYDRWAGKAMETRIGPRPSVSIS